MNIDRSAGNPFSSDFPYAQTNKVSPFSHATLPPTNPDLANISILCKNALPEQASLLGEIIDILSSTQNPKGNSRLSYLGDCLASNLTPVTAPIALKGMNSRSLCFVSSFLFALAKREFARWRESAPPITQGAEYAELRATIARVAVNPRSAFLESDLCAHRPEINRLTHIPLTILRRSVGEEIDGVAVEALTEVGLCPSLNRNAAELLNLRETSLSTRALSEDLIIRLVPILGDCLRDDLTRSNISCVIDRWLKKSSGPAGEAERGIQRLAINESRELLTGSFIAHRGGAPHALDLLTLLRHFGDKESRSMLWNVSARGHAGAALIATACLQDSPAKQGAVFADHLRKSNNLLDDLDVLHFFGYGLSEQTDLLVAASLDTYTREMWKRRLDPLYGTLSFESELQALLLPIRRRLNTEPVTSPILSTLFGSLDRDNQGLQSLSFAALERAATQPDVVPLAVYESPHILSRVGEFLSRGRQRHQLLSKDLSAALFFDGPARYGFQIGD